MNKKAESKFLGDGDNDQGYIGNFVGGIGRYQHLKYVDPVSGHEMFSNDFKGEAVRKSIYIFYNTITIIATKRTQMYRSKWNTIFRFQQNEIL